MNKIKQLLIFTFVAFSLSAVPAIATPLNLNLSDSPDIEASFLGASYDAISGVLSISGMALTYDDGVSNTALFDTFNLNALVDNSGNLFGGANTFAISTLLSGSLSLIGSSVSGGGTLEFLFEVTGGSLASAYGGVGAVGGIIMTLIDFPGDWNSDWTGFNGVADIAALAVAEPNILLLGGIGLTLLIVARRRKI